VSHRWSQEAECNLPPPVGIVPIQGRHISCRASHQLVCCALPPTDRGGKTLQTGEQRAKASVPQVIKKGCMVSKEAPALLSPVLKPRVQRKVA